MLGQIANYCPVISRSTIVKNSISLGFIWSAIRLHFGFEATGTHSLDSSEILLEHSERPGDLYQRLMAFKEDTLLRWNSIQHRRAFLAKDKESAPTLENFIVLTWSQLVHPDLSKLVKQSYRTELLYCILVSIKPEISQALQSLLDEIRATEDAKVMRTAASSYHRPTQVAKPTTRFRTHNKSCPLCKQAGRGDFHHYLSECTYQRQIVGILDCDECHPWNNQRTTNLRPLVSSLPPPPSQCIKNPGTPVPLPGHILSS